MSDRYRLSDTDPGAANAVSVLEINFEIPVVITSAIRKAFIDLANQVAASNCPEGCLHWVSTIGAKPIRNIEDYQANRWDPTVLFLETQTRNVPPTA